MSKRAVGRLIWQIVLGLVIITGGVLIVSKQEAFVKVVMVVAGIVALIEGIYTLVNLYRWQFTGATKTAAVIKGIMMIVLGVIAVCAPFATGQALFTAYIYIFAAGLVISAIIAVQNAYMLHKINAAIPVSGFAWEALIDIVVALILFCNPTKIMGIAVSVIGVGAIVFGAATIAMGFRTYRLLKVIKD